MTGTERITTFVTPILIPADRSRITSALPNEINKVILHVIDDLSATMRPSTIQPASLAPLYSKLSKLKTALDTNEPRGIVDCMKTGIFSASATPRPAHVVTDRRIVFFFLLEQYFTLDQLLSLDAYTRDQLDIDVLIVANLISDPGMFAQLTTVQSMMAPLDPTSSGFNLSAFLGVQKKL